MLSPVSQVIRYRMRINRIMSNSMDADSSSSLNLQNDNLVSNHAFDRSLVIDKFISHMKKRSLTQRLYNDLHAQMLNLKRRAPNLADVISAWNWTNPHRNANASSSDEEGRPKPRSSSILNDDEKAEFLDVLERILRCVFLNVEGNRPPSYEPNANAKKKLRRYLDMAEVKVDTYESWFVPVTERDRSPI